MPRTGEEATPYAKADPTCARPVFRVPGMLGPYTTSARGLGAEIPMQAAQESDAVGPLVRVHAGCGAGRGRSRDVVLLYGDASSEELEDEVRTVGGTLAETLGRSNGSGSGATSLCLNKMDLVSEERQGSAQAVP